METQTESGTDEWQHMNMRVGAEILKYLSRGIYSNPGNTIKELICNSYDADATEVVIRAKPEFDTITITDNGDGMTEEEFKKDFAVISRSRKRDEGTLTKRIHRPIVGRIGIGFISALQICDEATFITKKRGDKSKLEAKIDFGKFKGPVAKKAEFQEISEILYRIVPEEVDAHYTKIIMTKLSEDFVEMLNDKDLSALGIFDFRGIKFEQVISQIENKIGRGELEDFGKAKGTKKIGYYWSMLLQIANTIPVPYMDNGPIKDSARYPVIKLLKDEVQDLRFDVEIDGVHLRKPLRLPNVQDVTRKGYDYDVYTFKKRYSFQDGSRLRFKGYIYNQRKSILPTQFRGMIIRVKNVAIDGPLPDFLDYPYSEKMWLPWTMGEVYVEEGLEDAMNIDRNTFNLTHPHYRKLRLFLHDLLHKEVFVRVRKRYIDRMNERRKIEKLDRTRARGAFLHGAFGQNFKIRYDDSTDSKSALEIDTRNRTLVIYRHHPVFDRHGGDREFLEDILIMFETAVALSGGRVTKLRQFFLDSIKRW
jgi:hypothetical protein